MTCWITRNRPFLCRVLALVLWLPAAASAQGGAVQKLQSVLEEIERGLNYVGQKAEQIIGPGLGIGEERPAAYTAVRSFDERYPVGPTPTVSISNEFGTITVNTWNERVVQVTAEVSVGAEDEETAEALADKTQVSVSSDQDLVEIRNLMPEAQQDLEYVNIAVNYSVTVPVNANVVSDNFFGDTVIRGVGGLVAVEAQYGSLELGELSGTVKVRMHGEFPLKAAGLLQGGSFELSGAQAEFGNVAGELSVHNFRGSVLLRDIAGEASVEVDCDSGPVTLVLQPEAKPELTATVLYGSLHAPESFSRVRQASKTVARLPNAQSRQRIQLSTAFGDIHIQQALAQGAAQTGVQQGDELFNEVLTLEEAVSAGDFLTVDATVGDIRVEPTDGGTVVVKATRSVWMPTAARAPEALRALTVQAQRTGGQLTISTLAAQDLAALGVSSHSVNLEVQCPRNVPVTIRAQEGDTSVAGMAAMLNIAQAAGEVRVEKCEGELDLSNQKGSIQVTDCVGPVEAVARYGNLTLTRVLGRITTDTVQGATVVEAPMDDVVVRSTGGDVRILALEGVQGDYDVRVNNGRLRVLLDDQVNAELHVRTQNGIVYPSNLLLTGTIQGDTREFSTRLLEATHRIDLEAVDGDIFID